MPILALAVGDPKIARHREVAAAAEAIAVQRRDRRLARGLDGVAARVDGQLIGRGLIRVGPHARRTRGYRRRTRNPRRRRSEMMHRTSRSAESLPKCRAMSRHIASVMALRCAGRLMVTVAIRSAISTSRSLIDGRH